MEEPYPRSQSVMQTRGSTFQNKASKILQKVSHFRTRIKLSSHSGSFKTDDDSHMDLNRSPYMRETRSMDIDRHTKPYMSQPMLTIPNMLDPVSHDTDDYSSSSSPHHSPTRRTFDRDDISASTANITTGHRSNPNTHKNAHPNSKQGMSRTTVNADGPANQSIPRALMPVTSTATGTALGHGGRDVGIDGLPVPADNLLFLPTPPSTQTAKQKDPVTAGPPRTSKRDLERRYQKQLDPMTDASAQVKKGPAVAELDKGTRIGTGVTELKSHFHSANSASGSSSSQLHSSSRSTDSTPSINVSGSSSSSSSPPATRPPLSSSSSSTSVQSLGQASVLSTASSNSDASFKSFANSDLDGSSGSGPVLGLQLGTGMGVSGMRLAAGGGQGASASTVTITQSGSDMKQAQGHGRGMKEKELPSRPDSSTVTALDAVEMGKVSLSTSVAPPSPSSTPPPVPSKDAHTPATKYSRGRNVADDKSSTKSKTNNAPSHSPSTSASGTTSAAASTTKSSLSATPPSIPDHSSPPPLKRPSTSPAAPISPSQFTSFASIVEANSASLSPSITTTATDNSETTTPTQTTNHSLPIPSSSLSTSFSSQHVRASTTQVVPLPSPSSSSVSTPLSQSLPGRSQPNPTRRPTIPRLTTALPGHRFSLQMTDGEAIARFSPSIIIRQPVLPLNLPKLGERVGGETDANEIGGGGSTGESGTTRRPMTSPGHVGRSSSMSGSGSSGVRLKHMPALPMAGTSREATGREEEDTDSGESEDDEDDDGEDNDCDDHNEHAEEDDGDGDDDDTSRTLEQQQAAQAQAQAQKKASPFLPSLVERGSFLFDRKQGTKGKEKENFTPSQEESMKTPTIGATGAITPVLGGPSGMKTPIHVPTGQQDYFSARFSCIPDLGSPSGVLPAPSPGRPSLYKHASRSMLDIPGFAVGTPSVPASLSLSKPVETPKDGVLDGVKGMTRKKSKEGLGRKKSRDIKDQVKQYDAKDQPQQPQQRKSSENDDQTVQAPLPSTTNRDDLILEEPRRLGGAAIAAAAANLTSTLQTVGEHEASNVNNQGGVVHAQNQGIHTQDTGAVNLLTSLRRRRSMPSFTASSPPPPYPAFPLKCHSILELPPGSYELPPSSTPPPPTVSSRFAELQRLLQLGTLTGEEGNEKLPPYTNDIYLRAIMPRKMEFVKPGVQAKDRKWRRVVCELQGTVFRVYKCPAEFSGTGKVTDWWERKVGVGDVSVGQGVGGGGNVGGTVTIGTGANLADEQRREEERERARREKLEGETQVGGQTHLSIRLPPTLRIQNSTQTSPAPTPQRHSPTSGDSSSLDRGRETSRTGQSQEDTGDDSPRSRSRFAGLLKPTKTHHRSRSELPPSPRTVNTPRSSFNIPRPSFGASSSSDIYTSASSSATSMTPATSNQSLSLSVPTASTSLSSLAPPQSGSSLRSSSTTRSRASSRASAAPPTPNYPPGISCPIPDKNDLIRAYTLQNAESGLGNDYVKRKNVIRVRMEGEQFLMQARDVAEVVSWIEGLHAATNIALDLDERPMPRGPIFPRRRRRRPRRTENAIETGNDEPAGEGSNSNNITASVS